MPVAEFAGRGMPGAGLEGAGKAAGTVGSTEAVEEGGVRVIGAAGAVGAAGTEGGCKGVVLGDTKGTGARHSLT